MVSKKACLAVTIQNYFGYFVVKSLCVNKNVSQPWLIN